MRFVILGPTQLHVGGQRVDLGSAKQRALLALLLYHAQRTVSTDLIIEQLWTGRSHDALRRLLYPLVSRSRKALDRARVPGEIVTLSDGYRLDVDPDFVDFHWFRRQVNMANHRASRRRHHDAVRLLTGAIDLWRGTPLADLRGEWSDNRRRHMRDVMWLGANKRLFENQLAIGDHEAALAGLAPLVEEYEFDETLARQWIVALGESGRSPDASDFYMSFCRRFREASGSDPSEEVQAAYQEILRRRQRATPEPVAPSTDPPHAQSATPRQLPGDIRDFTGHEALLSELDSLVDPAGPSTGVVVIDGMPGVGKTTLAKHWAHRHRHLFPDGQLYLEADAYGPGAPVSPDDALGRFLSALGASKDRIPADGDRRRDRLSQLLDGRRLMVVLDNVLDSAQVKPLLAATASCLVLVTSRNKLTNLTIRHGAHSITVPPLTHEESVSLLGATIGTHRAHKERDAANALAELSGGLPLALRIIGHHVAERPRSQLDDLVEQLRRRLLAPGDEIDDEHETLRHVFAWSYEALPTEAAGLYRRLSLHPGVSISPDAAAALSGGDARHAERLLGVLAKANLLEHDAAHRYRFHDLLRLFAAECARDTDPPDHRREALHRLLDWYLLSANNAATSLAPEREPVPDLPDRPAIIPNTFGSHAEAMRWCDLERANLTAVTRCAAAHDLHHHAWQIPGAVHEVFERYGCQDDVLECHEVALTSVRAARHLEGQIGTLNNLAVTLHIRRDYDRAAALFEEGLRLAEDAEHRGGQAVLTHNLANVQIERGDFASAIGLYEQARQIYHDLGNPSGEAFSLHRLGRAYHRMEHHSRAMAYYEEALTTRVRIGHARGQGASHAALAYLHLEAGDHGRALEHARHALHISAHTKDQTVTSKALITKATVLRELEELEESIQDAQRANEICAEIDNSKLRVGALEALAHALWDSGKQALARDAWHDALHIADDISDPRATEIRTLLRHHRQAG